mmetsp:Transcript_233/g.710  ORF Transcript_233/g.710 Transcript_233/m.710 type:complete len:258 (+) Transcript_233:1536-2309(+)
MLVHRTARGHKGRVPHEHAHQVRLHHARMRHNTPGRIAGRPGGAGRVTLNRHLNTERVVIALCLLGRQQRSLPDEGRHGTRRGGCPARDRRRAGAGGEALLPEDRALLFKRRSEAGGVHQPRRPLVDHRGTLTEGAGAGRPGNHARQRRRRRLRPVVSDDERTRRRLHTGSPRLGELLPLQSAWLLLKWAARSCNAVVERHAWHSLHGRRPARRRACERRRGRRLGQQSLLVQGEFGLPAVVGHSRANRAAAVRHRG